jgi:small subunit ribosomal protein S17
VEIPRLVKHKKYGKYLRRRTVCHVHDEKEESHAGDTVEIVECPPKSKLKRWQLLRVVKKSQAADIAALRAASRRKRAADEAGAETKVEGE